MKSSRRETRAQNSKSRLLTIFLINYLFIFLIDLVTTSHQIPDVTIIVFHLFSVPWEHLGSYTVEHIRSWTMTQSCLRGEIIGLLSIFNFFLISKQSCNRKKTCSQSCTPLLEQFCTVSPEKNNQITKASQISKNLKQKQFGGLFKMIMKNINQGT